MTKLTGYLTTILAILMFLSIAPSLVTNIKKQYLSALKPHTKVGVVKIKNEIGKIDTYIKQLKEHFEDKEIKAILLEIDSGGGHAGASQALFNELQNFKKEHPKPVVTLVTDICASGAYYIACTSDHIITTPCAIVGSIGSIIGGLNFSTILKKYGVEYQEKHAGKYKMICNPLVPTNPDNDAMMQQLSDSCYEQFTRDVATCRKLSLKEVDQWAAGKVFTGEQALKLGLIDSIGSKCNATKKIKELAQLKDEEEIQWIEPKETSPWMSWMENKNQVSNLSADALVDAVLTRLQSNLITSN